VASKFDRIGMKFALAKESGDYQIEYFAIAWLIAAALLPPSPDALGKGA